MNKTLIIAKREYRAAVRTKSFIISLILLPIFMGGGFAVFMLMKDKIDVEDKKVVVLDRSGLFENYLKEAAKERNTNNILNEAGEKTASAYLLEFMKPDTTNAFQQKLELSNKVRNGEITGFVQIGKDVLHPIPGEENSKILYHAENAALDDIRGWLSSRLNNEIRRLRLLETGVDSDQLSDLFYWVNAEAMGLLKMDTKTGEVQDAAQSSELQSIMVPYILMLLMFMMLMFSAVPLLTSVMEEKSERIAEVLLGSITPTQFMIGKVLGGLGVSLTTAVIYIAGGIFTVQKIGMSDMIPYEILPWFFVYLLLNIIMVGSIMAALGSACNDSKDVQSIQFPAMLPLILPLMIMMPVIMNPLSNFAVTVSLIPIWTPMLMLLRQSTSVTIPMWQPLVGLMGVIIFTWFCVWAGGRIFRSAIIMQGKKPKAGLLIKYLLKG